MTRNVQFKEERLTQKPLKSESGMVAILIKYEIAKNTQQASVILTAIAIVFFCISILVLVNTFSPKETSTEYQPDPAELI